MSKSEYAASLDRLIEQDICTPLDIRKAKVEAEKLASPEQTAKIRHAERFLGALGDSNRIKILLLLSKREMCVCELESVLGMTQPTASHHLGILELAGLVERRKKGRWVFYKALDSTALELLRKLVT
ncbi:ArsR/SmtB family transcription factor [Caldisphaera sp.]|jgi:DNA-binding transcriptional ArsR family regulator|uniref:ArsR/SmtB family transcription factor n=1 Tax=Caldisphaera sp. TaxID=2060322 RepID=UPI000CCA5D7B|nr:MAG: ArsR family transcriptional regulator [Fervidicoccus fontis]